jgi:hypothetical protein
LAIATKKGFVEVFVIRVTPIGPDAPVDPPAVDAPAVLPGAVDAAPLPPEHAPTRIAAEARAVRPPRRLALVVDAT